MRTSRIKSLVQRIVNSTRMSQSIIPRIAPATQSVTMLLRIEPIPYGLFECSIRVCYTGHPIQIIVVVRQRVIRRIRGRVDLP